MRTLNLILMFLFAAKLYVSTGPVWAVQMPCQFEPLSDTVFFINGSDESLCPAKALQHPVTNPVALIGAGGVIIIDPGSSQQVGQLVIDRLRLITSKPVVAIINTHIHGLYWLANQTLKEEFPAARIYAHEGMIRRIQEGEGLFWLETITGKQPADRTRLALPDRALTGGETLNLNGTMLKIHHPENAHTDHDILIEIVQDKILLLGGLLVEPEVPSQGVPQDANFRGQIAAMKYAIQLDMQTYIPGQGYPQGVELVQRGLRFLEALYSGVENYYAAGLADYEITQQLKLELSEFKQWFHFDGLGRVIGELYLQVEEENF